MYDQRDRASSCSLPDFLYLEVLKRKIRRAEEPDNPQLLKEYFSLEQKLETPTRLDGLLRLLHQCKLLLDTIEDKTLPPHWRELCLNQVYKPIARLDRFGNHALFHQQSIDIKTRLREIPDIY